MNQLHSAHLFLLQWQFLVNFQQNSWSKFDSRLLLCAQPTDRLAESFHWTPNKNVYYLTHYAAKTQYIQSTDLFPIPFHFYLSLTTPLVNLTISRILSFRRCISTKTHCNTIRLLYTITSRLNILVCKPTVDASPHSTATVALIRHDIWFRTHFLAVALRLPPKKHFCIFYWSLCFANNYLFLKEAVNFYAMKQHSNCNTFRKSFVKVWKEGRRLKMLHLHCAERSGGQLRKTHALSLWNLITQAWSTQRNWTMGLWICSANRTNIQMLDHTAFHILSCRLSLEQELFESEILPNCSLVWIKIVHSWMDRASCALRLFSIMFHMDEVHFAFPQNPGRPGGSRHVMFFELKIHKLTLFWEKGSFR